MMIRYVLLALLLTAGLAGFAEAERFPLLAIQRNIRIERRAARRNGWHVPIYRVGGRLGGGPLLFPTLRFAPQ